MPAAAAGITLAVVTLALVLFFSRLFDPEDAPGEGEGRSAKEAIETGRGLLREGSFREAARLLGEARQRHPLHRELSQLYREADLAANLLPIPLGKIVELGQDVRRPEEWQARLRDFRGRGVIFDDVVRREAPGEYSLEVTEIVAGEETATLRPGLDLFETLPLGRPQRLVFGAKLADVSRGEGGGWVIEFEKDSGVLLTDEGAAAKLGLDPADPELREVLQRQAGWVRGQ